MTDTTLHFVIESDYARVREVQHQLMEAVRAHGFGEDARFAIKLALEEGLINAIKHGNKCDPDKQVVVDARVSDQAAEFTIVDQGAGFLRAEVPNPIDEANLEKASGRGLLLIETYMSDVRYSDNGRRLWMIRRK